MEGAIEREFETLLPLAGEMPNEDLRGPLKEMLDHARMTWEQGDKNGTIQILEETRGWVHEHWDEIGVPLAEKLEARLERIIRLAIGQGSP